LTEPVVNEFLSFLRFSVFDEDINTLINLMILQKNNKDLEFSNSTNKSYSSCVNNLPGISIKNELAAMYELDKIVTSCLNEYETTLEKDIEILQSDDKERFLSNNQKNCLLMRIGEKKILFFFKSFANYIIDLFSLSVKELKKKIKKDFPLQCPYEEYINDVVLSLIRKASSK
jgi:histone-lysine N-methyltransferase SETD3